MPTSVCTERHIPVEGMTNLRSLGGYQGADGKRVRWGLLYRSDVPHNTAANTLCTQLHVRRTFDLRADMEVSRMPYNIVGIERISVPITPPKYDVASLNLLTAEYVIKYMTDLNRQFIHTFHGELGIVLRGIIASKPTENNASLIHCTAGKDRTGWVCYVILRLLGVSHEDALQDYLLTNTYYQRPESEKAMALVAKMPEEAQAMLWTVHEQYLAAAVEEVNKVGGVEKFVIEKVGLSEAELKAFREMFLE